MKQETINKSIVFFFELFFFFWKISVNNYHKQLVYRYFSFQIPVCIPNTLYSKHKRNPIFIIFLAYKQRLEKLTYLQNLPSLRIINSKNKYVIKRDRQFFGNHFIDIKVR